MEHITNVLVYSNRCEVLDSHIFSVGDKGFPHIRLKFLYMFGVETLQGKELELKYILPDKSYQVEKIIISEKDEALFPIHYSVFVNGGWTTLKVTILEDANRIALDDIIIKTKKLEVGQEFKDPKIESLIQAEVVSKTKEIAVEGGKQKKLIEEAKIKVLEEIENKRKTLKGDKGEQGIRGERGVQGEKGEKGDIGPQGERGLQGLPGTEIQDLTYIDNKLKLIMSDNSSKEVEIKSGGGIKIRKVFEGHIEDNQGDRTNINLGDNWKVCICDFSLIRGSYSTFGNIPRVGYCIFFRDKNLTEQSQRMFEGMGDFYVDVAIINNNLKFASYMWYLKRIYIIEELETDEISSNTPSPSTPIDLPPLVS